MSDHLCTRKIYCIFKLLISKPAVLEIRLIFCNAIHLFGTKKIVPLSSPNQTAAKK